jgi:hypothetical protein
MFELLTNEMRRIQYWSVIKYGKLRCYWTALFIICCAVILRDVLLDNLHHYSAPGVKNRVCCLMGFDFQLLSPARSQLFSLLFTNRALILPLFYERNSLLFCPIFSGSWYAQMSLIHRGDPKYILRLGLWSIGQKENRCLDNKKDELFWTSFTMFKAKKNVQDERKLAQNLSIVWFLV